MTDRQRDHHRRGRPAPPISVTTTEDVLVEPRRDLHRDPRTCRQGADPARRGEPFGDRDASNATGTITDDDTAPTKVSLSRCRPSEVAENAAEAADRHRDRGPWRAESPSTAATAVTVSVGGGTATEGTDYATVADFTLTIAAGSPTGTATFDLDPTDDTTVAEGSETVAVYGHRAPGERADGRTARP